MASKKTVKKSAAPAKAAKVGAPARTATPVNLPSPSQGPLALELQARQDGSAEVVLVYEGALAARDAVLARAGTWRSGGAPWGDAQDVRLTRAAPNRWVGAIPVRPGAPVEAVELAFHAGGEWDNGGRAPLGYYEWNVRDRQLVVR
ncbi:MAG: hypothetical protein ACJ79E_19135 [Anaeromyxobacteraceae bacterium]